MKIFAIRDKEDISRRDLAYLLYYKIAKAFYIELPRRADPWEMPLILSSFARRGEYTLDSHWSKLWVEQRIVPPDRQNIGHILREHDLKGYDEYDLLMIASGRCEQDSYYLAEIRPTDCPEEIRRRWGKKVRDALPLSDRAMMIFFKNGRTAKCDIASIVKDDVRFAPVLDREEIFFRVEIQPGGYGIRWGEELSIPDDILYNSGRPVPLKLEDIKSFIKYRAADTAEVGQILDCSRQNVDDLVRKGKLTPIKNGKRSRLFLKSDLILFLN